MASHAYVPDLVRAAISWGALVSSFRTIRSDDEALFRDDGFRVRGWRPGELRGDVNSNMQIVFGAQLRRLTDLTWLPAPHRQFVFDDVAAGSSTFDELAMILRHAYEDGSDLRMFISPVHAQVLETFREAGLMEQYYEWQRRLVDVSEREARIQGKPAFSIWDFSGYNQITTERVPGAGDRPVEMNGYLDPSHFSRATGSLILDAVLGCRNSALAEEEGVAVLLNSTSIEGHIANTRRAGTAYRLQNSSVKR